MLQLIFQSLFIFFPAAVANMMPVFVKNVRFLRKPVDFGLKIKGKPIFGENKTWRGLFFGIVGAIAAIYLEYYLVSPENLGITINFDQDELPIVGALLGLGALGGDLIKSFFKRRKNIPPGTSWWGFDQLDWILGAEIVFYFISGTFNVRFFLFSVVLFGILHLLVNYLGYALKLKENMF